VIPSKGVHVLVEAFRRLKSTSARLHIFGAGYDFEGYVGYEERVQRMASVDARIRFEGQFANEQVRDVFAKFDILVVPSIWYENSPLTIQEASLSCTPVIASDIGGMAEFVKEGKNGLVFHVGDPRDLGRKMRTFLDNEELTEKLRPDPESVRDVEDDADCTERLYEKYSSRAGT
jgi:glycosyltransferase involved in cell wall biosynthesis